MGYWDPPHNLWDSEQSENGETSIKMIKNCMVVTADPKPSAGPCVTAQLSSMSEKPALPVTLEFHRLSYLRGRGGYIQMGPSLGSNLVVISLPGGTIGQDLAQGV